MNVRLSIFLFLSLVLLSKRLSSQVFFDTVSVRPVGPGMLYYHVVAPDVPWSIHVLTVDLADPFLSLETVKANDRLSSREIVRSMAQRKNSAGHLAIGAINGDFYGGDGSPVNVQIAQGEFVRAPVSRPALGFDTARVPMMDIVTMNARLILDDTAGIVHRVNAARITDNLVLYNSYFGASTTTNQFGTEVLLDPITPWIANDTIVCIVGAIEARQGDMAIPAGAAVLSGHGLSESGILSRLSVGDTVKLYQGITPGLRNLKEMIGGYPKLVVNGHDVSYTAPREPRTAAGFSADSTTLYLVAVDGRQLTLSVGMTFQELAQFMIGIGVHQGMNLDGGGSTTMIIRGEVTNSPSDGAERAVSNGLVVFSSAPTGSFSTVALSPKSSRVFRGLLRQFAAYGVDTFGNPIAIDSALLRYSCSPEIGVIDSLTGFFQAGQNPAVGYVSVSYEGSVDSALVVVKTIGSIRLSPRDIVTDTTRQIRFDYTVKDVDGVQQSVAVEEITWISTDTTVGSVSSAGVFSGRDNGSTLVIAAFETIADTVSISVEIGVGSTLLSALEDAGNWTTSSSFVDAYTVSVADSFSSEGSGSMRIEYAFTGSANDIAYVYIDVDIPIFGVPDSILLDGRTEESPHRVYYIIADDDGEQYRVYSSRLMNTPGAFEEVRASVEQATPLGGGGLFNYPIRLKRIEVQLVYYRQAGTQYSGTLYLDNLRASYPQKVVTGIPQHASDTPQEVMLFRNYPNPFNPETSIEFQLPSASSVTLIVYDIRGREVQRLLDGQEIQAGSSRVVWDGRNTMNMPVSSGVYFYVLRAQGIRHVGRMLLLR